MKKLIFIFILISLFPLTCAIQIQDISIEPENPTIEENVEICTEIISEYEIESVMLKLEWEDNAKIFMYEQDDKYCRIIQPDYYYEAQVGMTIFYKIIAEDRFDKYTTQSYSFTYQESQESICGNNILEQNEECEDGNLENEDGCSSECLIESEEGAVCGNWILEQGEQCDDGNLINNDGCSNNCHIETQTNQTTTQTYLYSSHTSSPAQFCDSNWQCSAWSDCNNNIKTRTCHDTNYCKFKYNKPTETINCELASNVFVKEKTNYLPLIIISSMIILVLVLIIFVLVFRR
ncbi:DUF4215 domain-containing protein [Nanoarchaeota archaeon]